MRVLKGAACVAALAATLFTTSCTRPAGPAPVPEVKPTTPTQLLNACELNLKQMGTALQMYAGDAKGAYPTALGGLTPKYLTAIPTCPVAQKDTYTGGYATAGSVFTVVCAGEYHTSAQVGPNFPQYTTPRTADSATPAAPASPASAAPSSPSASGTPGAPANASGTPTAPDGASGSPGTSH